MNDELIPTANSLQRYYLCKLPEMLVQRSLYEDLICYERVTGHDAVRWMMTTRGI
jgi:hypothetical protein